MTAEIERLLSWKSIDSNMPARHVAEELQIELRAALLDVERLDWLNCRCDIGEISLDEDLPGENPRIIWNAFPGSGAPHDVRAAIDAARAAIKKEQEG